MLCAAENLFISYSRLLQTSEQHQLFASTACRAQPSNKLHFVHLSGELVVTPKNSFDDIADFLLHDICGWRTVSLHVLPIIAVPISGSTESETRPELNEIKLIILHDKAPSIFQSRSTQQWTHFAKLFFVSK